MIFCRAVCTLIMVGHRNKRSILLYFKNQPYQPDCSVLHQCVDEWFCFRLKDEWLVLNIEVDIALYLCDRGGQERMTFSVLWEMNDKAEILNTQFTKAVIKSRAAMTYQEAQVGTGTSSPHSCHSWFCDVSLLLCDLVSQACCEVWCAICYSMVSLWICCVFLILLQCSCLFNFFRYTRWWVLRINTLQNHVKSDFYATACEAVMVICLTSASMLLL